MDADCKNLCDAMARSIVERDFEGAHALLGLREGLRLARDSTRAAYSRDWSDHSRLHRLPGP